MLNFVLITGFVVLCAYMCSRLANRPRRVHFVNTGNWGSQEYQLPVYFKRAWECLESNNTALATAPVPNYCPICNRALEGRYGQQYRFKRFIWSGLEREHMMYAHVTYGDDVYYLPDPAFINAVIQWYDEEYLPMAQSHFVMKSEIK